MNNDDVVKLEEMERHAEELGHQPFCMSEHAPNHCSCSRGVLLKLLNELIAKY